jgi:hypothetical protein
MFKTVSFFDPSGRLTGEKTTLGGAAVTPLKKLYGARLRCPEFEMVETHAIGRGVIKLTMRK